MKVRTALNAHVHGVTPLLQCSVDPANAGANQTNSTPAAAANGGPITGLIPATSAAPRSTWVTGGSRLPCNARDLTSTETGTCARTPAS